LSPAKNYVALRLIAWLVAGVQDAVLPHDR
jgi:hypothetical protein